MNGQKLIAWRRELEIQRQIRRYNPLKKHPPLNIDLHAYSAYLEEHNIKNEDITPEIVEMFRVNREPQVVEKKSWVNRCLNRISGLF